MTFFSGSGDAARRTLGVVGAGALSTFVSIVGVETLTAQQIQVGLTFRIQALDDSGAPVTDLRPEEVVVALDDTPCPVVDFELVGWPLRVVVLVDDSVRMEGYLVHLRNALPALVEELPQGAEVAVVMQSYRPDDLLVFSDRETAASRLGGYLFKSYSRASVARALVDTAEALSLEEGEGPVIAVVSADLPSTLGRNELGQLAQRVLDMGATVDTLVLNLPNVRLPPGVASRLTELTGGWHSTVAGPSTVITRKLREMGQAIARRTGEGPNHYLVTCQPRDDGAAAEEYLVAVLRNDLQVRVNGRAATR